MAYADGETRGNSFATIPPVNLEQSYSLRKGKLFREKQQWVEFLTRIRSKASGY
jgi:hypothetical protein